MQGVVELHERGLVAAAVAVVGRAEDGDDVLVVRPVVALHDQLVGARNERQPVAVVEALGDVHAKREPGAARRDAPAVAVVRVGPQQVAHRTLVRHLLDAVQRPDAVQRRHVRRQAPVQAENLNK